MDASIFIWWVPLVMLVSVVAPVWIVAHYLTRWRESRRLAQADSETLVALWESTRRMEQRIDALERILDARAPEWRQTP